VGPVTGIATQPLYLDVAVPAGARFVHEVPPGHNALVYVFEGAAEIGGDGTPGTEVRAGQLAVLGEGDAVEVVTRQSPARFLLIAARPIGEPIARYGPFVMNTRAEVMQALRDLEANTFLG
jgi:hypothetical protein